MCEAYSGKIHQRPIETSGWAWPFSFTMHSDREVFITHWKKSRSSRKKSFCCRLNYFRRLLGEIPIEGRPLIDYRATMFCLDAFLSRWWDSRQVPSRFSIVSAQKRFLCRRPCTRAYSHISASPKNRTKEKCKRSTSRRHMTTATRTSVLVADSNYRVISGPEPNACGHGETWQNMHIVLLLGG